MGFTPSTRGHRTTTWVVSRSISGRFEALARQVHSLTASRRGDGVERVTTLADAIAATRSSSRSLKTLSQHPNFSSLTLSKSFSMWTWIDVGSLDPRTESSSSSEMK